MTISTTHKLNLEMLAAGERGPRVAASAQTAIGAGFKDGSLAVRWMR